MIQTKVVRLAKSELKAILIDGGAAYGHDIFEEELDAFATEIDEDSHGEISKLALVLMQQM